MTATDMKMNLLSLLEKPKRKPLRHGNTEKTNLKLRDSVSSWFKSLEILNRSIFIPSMARLAPLRASPRDELRSWIPWK